MYIHRKYNMDHRKESPGPSSCNNSMVNVCALSCFISCIVFLSLVDHIICEDLQGFWYNGHVIQCCFRGCICISVESH